MLDVRVERNPDGVTGLCVCCGHLQEMPAYVFAVAVEDAENCGLVCPTCVMLPEEVLRQVMRNRADDLAGMAQRIRARAEGPICRYPRAEVLALQWLYDTPLPACVDRDEHRRVGPLG